MRDVLLWGAALLFLLAALYTVAVRREVYELGRANGKLEKELTEQRRQADNLLLARERMRSPAGLEERARQAGLIRGEGK